MLDVQIIEGTNTICIPGIIDRHVHITGGGGDGGFPSRCRWKNQYFDSFLIV
ncbi:hypothetical protein NLX69_14290 [Rossellomorea sp. BNER]|nr:hypothetical protein [Rossellomorea sp. BNER]